MIHFRFMKDEIESSWYFGDLAAMKESIRETPERMPKSETPIFDVTCNGMRLFVPTYGALMRLLCLRETVQDGRIIPVERHTDDVTCCPDCGTHLMVEPKTLFCRWCGYPLDWSRYQKADQA